MMSKSNDEKDFGFLAFFGMAGNARLVLVFLAVIIMLFVSISNLDLDGKIDKFSNALNPVTTIEDKIIYIQALDEFVGYPPYGEIHIFDCNTGKDQRITFDEYYDTAPTYSKHLNTIYFESKRKGDVAYELMSAHSDLYGYNLDSREVSDSRELVAFSLEYDDSEILSPIISNYNDSLIAFFEKRYTIQNLVVCNYLSKKVMVRLPVKPHVRTYIDSFLKNYVSVYDANRSSANSLGTYFVPLVNKDSIQHIPEIYKTQYYFTGKSEDDKYFAVSRDKKPKVGIYSYELPSGDFTLINEIHSSSLGQLSNDLAVEFVLNRGKIIFYYSDNDGEKLYTLNNGSLKLLVSSKHEMTDFEFH